MRVVALLATYNEQRFLEHCLCQLREQGVETYLIDNESTDATVEIAERHMGDGVIGIETLPREGGVFSLRRQLRRKEELARELAADWFIHLDTDEVRLPPPGAGNLVEALETVAGEGCNAVNFLELSFVPTRESPAHDHPEFARTLRTYYPLLPEFPHQLKAWKATPEVDLAWKAGHQVRFPDRSVYPDSFPMKHYLFLSVPHAVEKYVGRRFAAEELASGWHTWRQRLTEADIVLPSAAELRTTQSDTDLDPSGPSKYHCLDKRWTGMAA